MVVCTLINITNKWQKWTENQNQIKKVVLSLKSFVEAVLKNIFKDIIVTESTDSCTKILQTKKIFQIYK